MALGAIGWMQGLNGADSLLGLPITNPVLFFIGLAIVLYTMFGWWGDTIKEAHEGHHTRVVGLHLRYGMIMFIASEVMFFVAWFWAFFDASLFYDEAQQVARRLYRWKWPPAGIEVLDPLHLPLYNTVILLLSGTTVTWAHHALLHGDRKGLIYGA
jgi:cytochrome c oxidase subunit 3